MEFTSCSLSRRRSLSYFFLNMIAFPAPKMAGGRACFKESVSEWLRNRASEWGMSVQVSELVRATYHDIWACVYHVNRSYACQMHMPTVPTRPGLCDRCSNKIKSNFYSMQVKRGTTHKSCKNTSPDHHVIMSDRKRAAIYHRQAYCSEALCGTNAIEFTQRLSPLKLVQFVSGLNHL